MIEHNMSPHARGYRVGTRSVLDIDPPPPGLGSSDRAEYRRGFHEGRRDFEAHDGRFLVFSEESGTRELLGEYTSTEEDSVAYWRSDGTLGWAPADCVEIVREQK